MTRNFENVVMFVTFLKQFDQDIALFSVLGADMSGCIFRKRRWSTAPWSSEQVGDKVRLGKHRAVRFSLSPKSTHTSAHVPRCPCLLWSHSLWSHWVEHT